MLETSTEVTVFSVLVDLFTFWSASVTRVSHMHMNSRFNVSLFFSLRFSRCAFFVFLSFIYCRFLSFVLAALLRQKN